MKLKINSIIKKINNWHNLLLLTILFIGLVLRLQGVVTNTFAYTYDVGRDLLKVREIIVEHKIPLIGPTTGFQGIFYGPWWYYMLTIPYIIFQGDPQGIALFMAILGCISIILGYIVGLRIQGVFLGLILATLVAFSPPMVSSQIWNPYMAIPFILLLFLCIYQILNKSTRNKKKYLYYAGAGTSLGLILDSEIFFGVLFSFGVCISLIILLNKKIFSKNTLIFLFGFLLILLPRIIFDLRHEFLMTNSFMHLLSEGLPQTHYTPFASRFTQLLDTFGALWTYTIMNGRTIIALVILFFLCGLVIYERKQITTIEKKFLLIISIILSIFFIYFLTNSTDIFEHYVIGIPVLFLVAAAIVFSQMRHIKKGKTISTILLIAFSYIIISPIDLLKDYDFSTKGDISFYRNQLAVIDYVYHDADGKPFSYKVFTPPIHDYTYQYLFLWYGNKKYGYTPSDQQSNIYYILEPDKQFNNYRLNLWLKDRSEHGKIIFDKTVNSGVRIQKRLLN